MLLLFLFFFANSPEPAQASDSNQTAYVGCLSRLPGGELQLGMLPSGKTLSIEGNTEPLRDHVNQLVRVFGRAAPSPNRGGTSKLTVSSVEVVAETCTASLPAAKTQTVEGKVGEDQIAIPVATTASSEEITPGFQTEGGMFESPGLKKPRLSQPKRPATPPYAPFEPEQVAQSEAAANINAEAALRAEILPGKTLGAGVGLPNAAPGSTGANLSGASTSLTPGSRVVVVDITGDGAARLAPQRVNIRVGETIQWRNSSGVVHEIVANPAKARGHLAPSLPAGAGPFDSGFVRPDHSFTYRFTVPGVYRYIFDPSGEHPVMGEIVVSR